MRDFVLGVDLDGVCAEHTLSFRSIVAERLGVEESSLPLERSWDFHEWGFAPGDFEAHHRAAVLDHRMFRTCDAIEGAADTLWRLSDAGVWIRIITHRLYVNWGHAVAVADTVAWLDDHRIPYRDLCFLGAKPEVEADLYIDDGPHNIDGLRAAGNQVIAFDQPYNRDVAHPGPRAATWAEVEEQVMERFAAHRADEGVQPTFPGLDDPASRLRNVDGQP